MAVMILGCKSLNKQIFCTWKGIELMQRLVLSYFIIIVLVFIGCTSSSGNRGKEGIVLHRSGLAKNTTFSNPSSSQCAWWKKIRYHSNKCD